MRLIVKKRVPYKFAQIKVEKDFKFAETMKIIGKTSY